jgi:agmatinase
MQLKPPACPFLSTSTIPTPCVILLGAGLDRTESFKSGTSEGPDRVRAVSDVLETYSPTLGLDLADLTLADWGNVDLDAADMDTALESIAEATAAARNVGLPILLGGEHTVTVGALRGILRRYPDLIVVHADAHTDLRDTYEGQRLSHATVMRRIADEIGLGRIAQFGIRSGTREEFELARGCLQSGPAMRMTDRVRAAIAHRPVYLTIDIDVLDPSCAPGTGCPEPGGAQFSELVELVYSLRDMHVVAIDITEVLPSVDVNDITSVAAAKLVRECALAFAPRQQKGGIGAGLA